MDIQYDKVGRRIKNMRLKQHIKQADLADLVGVSHTYMSEIERGQTRVGLEILVNICLLQVFFGKSCKHFWRMLYLHFGEMCISME